MFRRHLGCALGFVLVGMGSGCTIRIGPLDEAAGGAAVLPDPGGGSGDEPALDAAQQARKEEVDRYIMNVVYKGGTIVQAVRLPSGDVVDFIDRSTLPAPPYELPALPFGPEDLVLPPGVSFGLTELEQIPELLELAASATPFVRPSFWPYILGEAPDATSAEDYLARFQEGGAPLSAKRLYAGLVSVTPNHGVLGFMNQYKPMVGPDSFSLIEFTVSCPAEGPAQELIGIVISVDKYNRFGPNRQPLQDGDARMHIEYARTVNGKVQYVWDGMDGQFVDNPFRLHQPGEIVPVSVLNESILEHSMAIVQVSTGDWWIVYNGNLLGYFRATLFTQLNAGACRTAWYGEVMNKSQSTTNQIEMGSGQFAEAGLFKAAYVRNPRYVDLLMLAVEPKDEFSMVPYEPLCYSRTLLTYVGAPTYSSFMLLGGSGKKNPGCKWP